MPFQPIFKASIAALILGVALSGSLANGAENFSDLESCAAAVAAIPVTQKAPSKMQPDHSTPGSDSLRVVSWNVMKYRREGAELLLERLAKDTDFLALQEGIRDVIASAPNLEHRYFANGYARGDEQSGVELRSRFQANLSCSLSFREPWLRTPKALIATHHYVQGIEVLVVSLHAINFTFWISDLREQFAAVGRLLEAHGGPAIVMGDFNNWNAYRQAVINRFAKLHRLEIVEFEPDLRSRHLGVPVDGLLQRGFETLSAAAIPTIASDHHPILALLKPYSLPASEVDSRAPGGAPGQAP